MPATNGAAPMMEETVEVTETITEDQGPNDFKSAVRDLKATFTKEIDNYIEQAGVENIGKYFKSMNVAYNNQLNNLRKQFKVEILDPEDQLFTPEFLAEFEEIPGMKSGGISMTQEELNEMFGPNVISIETFNALKPHQQAMLVDKGLLAKIERDKTTAGSSIDMTALNNLLQERRDLSKDIGEAARSGYASIGSTGGHFLGARSAGRKAELSARDAALADEIGLQKALLTAQAKGEGVGGLDFDFTAKESENFTLADLIKQEKEDEDARNLWLDIQKLTTTKAGNPKLGKALQGYLQATNGQVPPPYQGEERLIPKLKGTDDEVMTLSDYYYYVLQKAATDTSISINEELEKWVTTFVKPPE